MDYVFKDRAVRSRRAVRSLVFDFIRCKRQNIKSLQCIEPPLSLDRVRDASVFEVTGVDFAGPVYLAGGVKAWICLFTCAVYRSVSLDLTTSLSTAAFIALLRRFISRRGRPVCIYSDNATIFVGLDNSFKQLNWAEIKKYSACNEVCFRTLMG